MSRGRLVRWQLLPVLCVATTVWAIALLFATVTVARSSATVATSLSAAVYFVGALVCHQLPARSFHYLGVQLPVCARCAGLYAGAVVGAWLALGPGRGVRQRAGSVDVARRLLMLAAIPAALTIVYEWSTGIAPSNVVRAGTGLVVGAAIIWLIAAFGSSRLTVEVN